MIRHEVQSELESLAVGARHEHWYGKTYRAFWDWFWARAESIEAMAASDAELVEIKDAVMELTANADDGGFAVPEGMEDDLILEP